MLLCPSCKLGNMKLTEGYVKRNEIKSWTLISRHMRNVAEKKCFSANVPKVLIFGLLVWTATINDFSF